MNSFGNKVKYFFGLEGEDELDYHDDIEQEHALEEVSTYEESVPVREYPKRREAPVEAVVPVTRPTSKLIICKYTPLDHRETTSMIDDIRGGRPVIINFQETEDFIAAKIINICEGAAYALDADISKIANDIYIVIPQGVDLKSHVPEQPEVEIDEIEETEDAVVVG